MTSNGAVDASHGAPASTGVLDRPLRGLVDPVTGYLHESLKRKVADRIEAHSRDPATTPHPRRDPIYTKLDADVRDLEDHRYTLSEAMFNRDFYRKLKSEGHHHNIWLYPAMGIVMVGMLIAAHLWLRAFPIPPVPYVGSALEIIAGTPIVVDVALGVIVAFAGVYLGWRSGYFARMAPMFISEPLRRVVRCWYPKQMLAERADQISTGEYILTLPPCCDSPKTCGHPTRMLYERDLESSIPSASATALSIAQRKRSISHRVRITADRFHLFAMSPLERLAKYAPWVLVNVGLIILGFFILNLDDPTPYVPPAPVVPTDL